MRSLKLATLLVALTATTASFAKAPVGDITPEVWDEYLGKAKELVNTLSLGEKVVLTTGVGWNVSNSCVGNIGPVPKIGFKGYCLQDGPAGIRFIPGVSVFPTGINVAATWDKDLMRTHGVKMAEEFRGKGINVMLGPSTDFMRAPEGGRAWEGFGADPFLASAATSSIVKGVQSQGVIATAKHFFANNQEHVREQSSSDMDDRTMHEIYLPVYDAAIKAGVGAVMCSYNLVNGTYACENDSLLNGVLKQHLGFKGFVMTDWWAGHSDKDTANHGSDMMMPGTKVQSSNEGWWGANLAKLVQSGAVPQARLDDMATRILAPWLMMGQDTDFPETSFDSFFPEKSEPVDVQDDHKVHIRAVGAASTIVLKNENILPLSPANAKSLGVFGSDARTPANPNKFPDRGGVDGTVAIGWGSGTADFPYLVGPLDGIKTQAKDLNIPVFDSLDDADLVKAAEVAKTSDVAIVFAFAVSGEGYITVNSNKGDRNDLFLWNNGDALIKTVADINKNTIVVIHSPGPVQMDWATHPNVKAVIHALLPGQESGNAIADVLFGKVNPSGRLPFTINKQKSDYAAHVQYIRDGPVDPASNKCIDCPSIKYTEGRLVDYRWNEAKSIEPLYAFGHGLSYTKFAYANLVVNKQDGEGPTLKVTVDVKNSGQVDGHEVAQLYLLSPAPADKPYKELKGFERVFLKASETKSVTFELSTRDLSYWSVEQQKWLVPAGDFRVLVGSSSKAIAQFTTLKV